MHRTRCVTTVVMDAPSADELQAALQTYAISLEELRELRQSASGLAATEEVVALVLRSIKYIISLRPHCHIRLQVYKELLEAVEVTKAALHDLAPAAQGLISPTACQASEDAKYSSSGPAYLPSGHEHQV